MLGNALEAEHVVSVGADLDFELGRLVFRPRRVVFGVIVNLYAEIEAEILELVSRVAGREPLVSIWSP